MDNLQVTQGSRHGQADKMTDAATDMVMGLKTLSAKVEQQGVELGARVSILEQMFAKEIQRLSARVDHLEDAFLNTYQDVIELKDLALKVSFSSHSRFTLT